MPDAGEDRRRPGPAHPARLTLRPLAAIIQAAVARDVAPAGDAQRVLDIGCGAKPYRPFFDGVARDYVGLDGRPAPQVDVVGQAESLPFGDATFDAVISTQTLEHVLDPARVVAEAHRVLRPGGVLLLSTHGTAVYHPGPVDLWRWTQEGLPKLLRDNGDWSAIRLEAAGGTLACLGHLIAFYVHAGIAARGLRPLRDVLVAAINGLFAALDRAIPLHYPRRYTLIGIFVVVARKADESA